MTRDSSTRVSSPWLTAAVDLLAAAARDHRVITVGWLAPAAIVLGAPDRLVMPLLGALWLACLVLAAAGTARREWTRP